MVHMTCTNVTHQWFARMNYQHFILGTTLCFISLDLDLCQV